MAFACRHGSVQRVADSGSRGIAADAQLVVGIAEDRVVNPVLAARESDTSILVLVVDNGEVGTWCQQGTLVAYHLFW